MHTPCSHRKVAAGQKRLAQSNRYNCCPKNYGRSAAEGGNTVNTLIIKGPMADQTNFHNFVMVFHQPINLADQEGVSCCCKIDSLFIVNSKNMANCEGVSLCHFKACCWL